MEYYERISKATKYIESEFLAGKTDIDTLTFVISRNFGLSRKFVEKTLNMVKTTYQKKE